MDNEKELEEIVKHACNKEGIAKHCPQRISEAIINAGYGKIKEYQKTIEENEKLMARYHDTICEQKLYAVKEFAERIKKHFRIDQAWQVCFHRWHELDTHFTVKEFCSEIDELVNELYGEGGADD